MIYTVTLNPTLDRTIHFPRLAVGELNRATSTRTDLSGKGINVSIALHLYGIDSVMMGLCAGVTGRILVEGLRDGGYACDFVVVDGETRSNITVIDDARGVTTKLNEPGPTITPDDLRTFEARLTANVTKGDICVFSGNLPPGAPANTYARLITALKSCGVLTVLDTSGDALVAGCTAGPDFLKPNLVEAVELVSMPFESEQELIEGIQAIRALGRGRILLSLGSQGAAYGDGDGIWLAQPPEITEVSAVGAGDASMAGALAAWTRHLPAGEIVRWAVASGTAAAMVDGSAMPTLTAIERTYAQVSATCLQNA